MRIGEPGPFIGPFIGPSPCPTVSHAPSALGGWVWTPARLV